ncbi:PLP-dependent aminotransferase family protein [Geothrix mesophila]|uniref:MocR-like pyridoxine biosynthesis transcription factor PdxR n=1 Tax=Geothrix mesophila TaxID=2922723 RepID=UPI002435D307|nr:PLP-dependent aminotransferase family protein [Geothrix sp. SG198]
MSKTQGGVLFPSLALTSPGSEPLYLRLYKRIREAILTEGLKPGTRLPSSRTLAADLGVSRTTAEEALAKLEGEGFLTRRVGDGTYVSQYLPTSFRPASGATSRTGAAGRRPDLSERGAYMAETRGCVEPLVCRPFVGGQPAPEAFPYDLWHRLMLRRSRASGQALLGYGDPAGYSPLREALSEYLISSRGVRCSPEQVLILTSSQQALDLACRMLLDPGDKAWIEDPGYLGARVALQNAGAELVPVPVDEQGLAVEQGIALAPKAKLAYVTPSHQYPTGPALSLERRLALLKWARRTGSWIIEDDYDSEFRYTGRPHPAIQGLEADAPVVYVGTLTKALFPSLRLAYVVAPKRIAEAMTRARSLQDGHSPSLSQAVLADFIHDGHISTHLRKMKNLYQGRRAILLEALAARTSGKLRVIEGEGGFHLTAFLPQGADDTTLSTKGEKLGLELPTLSRMYLREGPAHGFVLGFAALTPSQILQGVAGLAKIL